MWVLGLYLKYASVALGIATVFAPSADLAGCVQTARRTE